AGGVIEIRAAAARKDDGLALVSWQQECFGVSKARVDRRPAWLGLPSEFGRSVLHPCFGHASHHAAERAAWAAERGSRRTRVPGTAIASAEDSECDAKSSASTDVPPTMRTSRTPPSIARLAASSLSTMPPDTI